MRLSNPRLKEIQLINAQPVRIMLAKKQRLVSANHSYEGIQGILKGYGAVSGICKILTQALLDELNGS